MQQRRTVMGFVVALLLAGSAAAQQTLERDGRRLSATREELTGLLARLGEEGSGSAAAVASIVRQRLVEGDFHPGDGVVIAVEGEPQFSDTFVVGPERALPLPMAGAVSVRGVLHSEITAYLTERLGQFVRDPGLHARGLVRVSVTGAVARPGFHLVGADGPLSDAVMAAGGLTPDARLDALRVERVGKPLLRGDQMRRALAEGRTLDQADVRSGDQFVVPGRGRSSAYEQVRIVALLLSIPLTVYTLTTIF